MRCYQAQHALIDRRFAYFTLWLLFLLWVCKLCCVCNSCFVLCAHTWVLWIYRCVRSRLRFMCSLFFPQSQYYDKFENATAEQVRASLNLPVTSLAMICYLGWSLGKTGGGHIKEESCLDRKLFSGNGIVLAIIFGFAFGIFWATLCGLFGGWVDR